MPALRLREIQLPELHLPEMSRDDVVRVIGDARRDVSKVDLPNVDIPKAITSAVEAAGIVRATRRPRLPFIIGGLITVGLVGFALLTSPMIRPRLTALGEKIRLRIDERRSSDAMSDEPHAFDGAIAVPIEPSAFADQGPASGSPFDGSSDLPEGMGADPITAEESIRS